jgi:hypothetical protein
MRYSTSIALAASLSMSVSAQVIPWTQVQDDVLPLNSMMGTVYRDFALMHEIFGPLESAIVPLTITFDMDLIDYATPPNLVIAGQGVSLSGQINRVDESTWFGFSGIVTPTEVLASSHTVTITENGEGLYSFELAGETTTNGIVESFLEGWTLEWSPGGGFAVSTHSSGATDRVTLRNVDGRITYEWRITNPGTAQVSGTYDATTGTISGATGRIPAPASLALLGLAALAVPRRR